MADSILRLRVDSTEYDSKIKRAQQGLLHMEEACRKVGGTLAVLEKDEKDFVQSLGSMETVSKTARGRLSELTTAFTELSMQYKRLTDEEKQGDFGKALIGSLEQLKTRISETRGQLEATNREMSGTPSLFDQLTSRLTVNIDAVKLLEVGLKAGGAALDVVKDAFMHSESSADAWGQAMQGAQGAYDALLSTLNGGNWSGFFSNLEKAIQGGRDLYDVLDRLGSIKANNQAAIAMVQAQIQQLRVLKQQGKDVDDEIKSATQRLKELQGQSVRAGKAAGRTEIVNTLRNEVAGRNTTGVQINDSQLRAAASRALKEGQSYFDGMAKLVRQYEGNAKYQTTRTTYTQTGLTVGGSKAVGVTEFDLSKLSQQQQQQYLIAKAITEGEARIQVGISTFAQAVQEGAQSAREEFRGNRYALTGNGRVSGGNSGAGTMSGGIQGVKDIGGLASSLDPVVQAFRDKMMQALQGMDAAQAAGNAGAFFDAKRQANAAQKAMTSAQVAADFAVSEDALAGLKEEVDAAMSKLSEDIQPIEIKTTGEEVVDNAKRTQKAWQAAASAITSAGSAMQNIKDPATQVAGIVMQAIANIALGFSKQSIEAAGGGPFAWIAATLSGLAVMTSTIAQIKSVTKGYAEGGIVPGNSYSGDNQWARLNAGEVILNRAQAANVASALQSDGMQGYHLETVLSGEDLRVVLNRNSVRRGRGEYVTSKR